MINLKPLNKGTTNSMKSNRRKNTHPELIIREALRDAGYRGYRLQWKVPGRPDISYPGKKTAIFVNGCFWHRCPKCNLKLPVHNSEFWSEKFRKNIERDNRNYTTLKELGWKVIIIWECEINEDLSGCVRKITDEINTPHHI